MTNEIAASSGKMVTERELEDCAAERRMTVREVAEAMGVSYSAVDRTITKLFPNKKQNGKTTFLDEQEVSCISKELKGHHNLFSTEKVRNIVTDLEILENFKKANDDFVALLSRKYEEERQKREVAEHALDRIANGKGCFSMNQAAKALSLPYGNRTLFRKLREDGCLNADNSPTQRQIKEDHFKVVVKYVSEQVGNKPVTLVTGKGLVYHAKKFNTRIDETVQADA